jgi:hypothetical protein
MEIAPLQSQFESFKNYHAAESWYQLSFGLICHTPKIWCKIVLQEYEPNVNEEFRVVPGQNGIWILNFRTWQKSGPGCMCVACTALQQKGWRRVLLEQFVEPV